VRVKGEGERALLAHHVAPRHRRGQPSHPPSPSPPRSPSPTHAQAELIPVEVNDSSRSRPSLDPARARPPRKHDAQRPAETASAAATSSSTPRPNALPSLVTDEGGPSRGAKSVAGAKSAARVGGAGVSKEHISRSEALNKELRQKETALRSELSEQSKNQADDVLDVDELIRVRADLSACYIGAIRSKVELLEAIATAKENGSPRTAP